MTDLQTLTPAEIRANIAEEISKASGETEETKDNLEDDDAEEEQDEAGEGAEEEPSQEETEEEGAEEEVKTEEKAVPSFRLREERQKREAAEEKYNRLVAWIEEQTKQAAPKKEEKKIEPIDEEAYDELNDKLAKESNERQLARFEDRLEIEQVKAEAKYSDFNQAFDYYINFIADNIQDEREGLSKEQAQYIAKQQLSAALYRRHQNKQDIGGDYIYKRATKLGYKAAEAKKSGINHDAIEKNKSKTEKKQSDKIRVEQDGSKEDYVKTLVKPGMGLDIKKFKEQLAKEMKAAAS